MRYFEAIHRDVHNGEEWREQSCYNQSTFRSILHIGKPKYITLLMQVFDLLLLFLCISFGLFHHFLHFLHFCLVFNYFLFQSI